MKGKYKIKLIKSNSKI